jgi:hypothetical protein
LPGSRWATAARQAQLELVERLHSERVSQRGIARITGLSRPTIIAWLRKKVFRPIGMTLTPKMGLPEIQIDEQWSSVGSRQQKVWAWTTVERGSCRVVGFAVGDRGYLPRVVEVVTGGLSQAWGLLHRRVPYLPEGSAAKSSSSRSSQDRQPQLV